MEKETIPLKIPEAQGDLADQAQDQIDASLQEQIDLIRRQASKTNPTSHQKGYKAEQNTYKDTAQLDAFDRENEANASD